MIAPAQEKLEELKNGKHSTVRSELSWSHYRLLMRVDDETARAFYDISYEVLLHYLQYS